jgi:N-acetylneuraminic acid mutarotase
MKSKQQWFWGIGLVLLLLSTSMGCTHYYNGEEPNHPGYTHYFNAAYAYDLSYPSSWELEESDSGTTCHLSTGFGESSQEIFIFTGPAQDTFWGTLSGIKAIYQSFEDFKGYSSSYASNYYRAFSWNERYTYTKNGQMVWVNCFIRETSNYEYVLIALTRISSDHEAGHYIIHSFHIFGDK